MAEHSMVAELAEAVEAERVRYLPGAAPDDAGEEPEGAPGEFTFEEMREALRDITRVIK